MEIKSYQNNIHFTSRNATIRFADDMMRKVNSEYPLISSTKLRRMKNQDKFFDYIRFCLVPNISAMRTEMLQEILKKPNILNYWKVISDTVKKQKLGNCGEIADLMEITAKVNGIKNCHTAGLKFIVSENKIDHTFLYVNSKKPYIIDPWLGFADYVPNAMKRYEAEYCKADEKLLCYQKSPIHNLNPVERLKLEMMFPNLIMEKSPKVK